MDSASLQFVMFGLAVALISNFSQSRIWRSAVLLIASLVFLGLLSHQPLAFVPLAGFLLLGYAMLVLRTRGLLKGASFAVIVAVLAYAWLKRYTFLPQASFLNFSYLTLGLSYIFFRVLHLLIDAGDNENEEEQAQRKTIGFGAYLLYTLNFTTFVSGPIQRYDEFAADQFAEKPVPLDARTIAVQLERIVRGFFKVSVLAMFLDIIKSDALAQLSEPLPLSVRLFSALRLAVVYPLFLYSNFSGYIDIVIALARLMRLRLPENFDRPFSADSVMDFWNRWHMTLSNWLKTYVYNPLLLTLMRRIPAPAMQPYLGVFCFFVTFFLIGVWHGRTSEFVVFGVLTGGGISLNKLWQLQLIRRMGRKRYKEFSSRPLYVAFGRGLNFVWFSFTLLWFWADWQHIARIFAALSTAQWLAVWLTAWLVATAALAAWESLYAAFLSSRNAGSPLTTRYARVMYASALAWIAFVMTVLLNQPAPGIVYKAF